LNQEHAVVRAAEMRPMGPGTDTGDVFDAGSLCLDFIAALHDRRADPGNPVAEASRLAEWLKSRGLPEPTGGLTERDLDDAGALCVSIAALARALLASDPPAAEDIGRLNATGRHATPVFLMQAGGRRRVAVGEVDIAASLSVIARDAINLFTGPDVGRLRACASPDCELLFFDRSPSGRRRWCSMKRCGERVASASYRRRRVATAPDRLTAS
jgi:predicted RNA-binding Zn ribbon-like protein